MDDIWSIIGLSSLIASVVTVILGIIRDILVEKQSFKRQSEAEYIQRQIQVYSQIYFLLQRIHRGAIMPELFGKTGENIIELNNIIKTNSSFLESRVLNKWLTIMALLQKSVQEGKGYEKELAEHSEQLVLIIKEMMNSDLIPKYRKIVGETVPALE